MQLHKTKGIVLRTVKYGDTSVIAAIYTELFGLQSYIIKGVRQSTKKSQGKANYFQPAAMLAMEVYHHEQKQLQFIKEYEWTYLYEHVLFDVKRNAVALFVIELLQYVLKQPEANPELFYLIEDTLKQIDKGSNALVSNLPLYFSLHLGSELGFQVQGEYSRSTPILDLQEGLFLAEKPLHPFYVDGEQAKWLSQIAGIQFYNDLENILLNREARQQLLQHMLQYMKLHVPDFGELKSLPVLQSVLA
jgi:DNA repair protein RecO (recombination protein O)